MQEIKIIGTFASGKSALRECIHNKIMQEYKVKVYADGSKFWYQNGKLHREDGPAIEWSDGNREWYKNGKLHREDGPAVEDADGYKVWYIEGKELTKKEFNNRNNKVEVTLKDIAKAMNIAPNLLRIKEH
jgi:energy-coupling factor transporter ATP-binding protein EcfA2